MSIFRQKIHISAQDIDRQGRVNNVCYVQWMQDLATAHTADKGWDMARYEKLAQGWVVRRHSVVYKRPALLGEDIVAATWIASFASRQCIRRYRFVREFDDAVLVEAETQWVYIDLTSGRPVRIPDELKAVFECIADDNGDKNFLLA